MKINEFVSPCCSEPLMNHREDEGWVYCAQCWKEYDKDLVPSHRKVKPQKRMSQGLPCH